MSYRALLQETSTDFRKTHDGMQKWMSEETFPKSQSKQM
jgi:hypothetical protein